MFNLSTFDLLINVNKYILKLLFYKNLNFVKKSKNLLVSIK